MIISKTPYRVSFFGGGTDYPFWFKKNKGLIIGTSIDKYCYITLRSLPPFFNNKHRLVWSKIETVDNYSQIEHPAIRECLKLYNIKNGLEIHHVGDLPARSGIGSSSSFAVGLISALNCYKKNKNSKKEIAKRAIMFEQKILKEVVGVQDQIFASHGGFLSISINENSDYSISNLIKKNPIIKDLENHITLMYTGVSRYSSNIAIKQKQDFNKKNEAYETLYQLTKEAKNVIENQFSIKDLGLILDETWKIKKTLSNKISNKLIDEIYEVAKHCGVYGGKIIGAGGGGFILFLTNKNSKKKLKSKLKNFLEVPIKFENEGTKIIFNSKNDNI